MAVLPAPSRNWGPTNGPRASVAVAALGSAGATNRRALREMALLLRTHGGFTLSCSCDSITAGTVGDGVDRWDADSDIVGNTPGNAHSWALLNGYGQVVLDNDGNADGGGTSGSVWWSPSGAFTGGSTTARPTATDEQEITTASLFFTTANGSLTFYIWRCDTAGQEEMRLIGIHSLNATGPDIVFVMSKAASTPVAWSNKLVNRYHSGGTGNGGGRDLWVTTDGFRARVGTNNRAVFAIGDAPPTTLDLDGDRLLVPVGLTQATDGRLGFVDDWHFVAAAPTVANLATFSSTDGTAQWVNLGQSVWPWGNFAATGGANIAGAKLLVNYFPVAAPTQEAITITPTPLDGSVVAKSTALGFDVTCPTALRRVVITATYGGSIIEEVVYDGDAFSGTFLGGVNARTTITDGYHFNLLRTGGWRGTSIRLKIITVDVNGFETVNDLNYVLALPAPGIG